MNIKNKRMPHTVDGEQRFQQEANRRFPTTVARPPEVGGAVGLKRLPVVRVVIGVLPLIQR